MAELSFFNCFLSLLYILNLIYLFTAFAMIVSAQNTFKTLSLPLFFCCGTVICLLYLLHIFKCTSDYGKCSKISNTLKLRTPKIIAENNF